MADTAAQAAARAFLDRFTAANDASDVDALGGCFAGTFLAGDANGARPVPRDVFLAAVPRRRQAFAEAGIGNTTLVSYSVTELDDHYLLVHTAWSAARVDGGEPVELRSSFLLYRNSISTTALAYLNHKGI